MRYTFAGHETFTCKNYWLKKGYDHTSEGKKFNDEAVIDLGVGKNMVNSISFWLKAFGLSDNDVIIDELIYNIIGSYGTGKSVFLLAFSKHLLNTERIFSPIEGKFNDCRTFKFINLVGKYESIIDIFANHFDVEADEEVILSEIQTIQRAARKTNECVVIVFDEFGKALEYSAKHNPERDLYFIKRLSEYVNNEKRNILFISTLHQNFDAYSIGLTEKDRKEWEKVKGRVKEIPFNEPVEQLLNLASKVISEKFSPENKAITKGLLKRIVKNRLFGLQTEVIDSISQGLYPLDILAASCLVVNIQEYRQNELIILAS